MGPAATLLLLLHLAIPDTRVPLLINEVQAANRGTLVDPAGHTADWIELYNPGDRAVLVQGMRLVNAGRVHPIDAPLQIAPKGHLVLHCSGHPERGMDHVGFTLSRSGGTLLLIGADGTTVLDVFTWPAMDGDLSMGRLPDGGSEWSFFEHPTPAGTNAADRPVRERTATPRARVVGDAASGPVDVHLTADPGAQIRYTTDGSAPTRNHGRAYDHPIRMERTTVLRATAWMPGRLTSDELCSAYMIGGPHRIALHIAIDPEDLHGPGGINEAGEHDNHIRTGWAWERPVRVTFPSDTPVFIPAGMRIAGSGSRSYPKRSFKLVARDRYDSPEEGFPFPDGTHFRAAFLRADAGPHAFMRNRFIEEVVLQHGLYVDVQPSTTVPLYLNGSYWGSYRWMPPKDAEWARHVLREEAVDVLEGPSAVAVSGNDGRLRLALEALFARAPVDSIDALMETRSLIDLACIDLWTGRADHDINVRCHRPRRPGGRWRWVLYDMDLWTPPGENSVERMCTASVPETPYVPQLLEHPELQLRMLARLTALQATAFHPDTALPLADSIHAAHGEALRADHDRWARERGMPDPGSSLQELRHHIIVRPDHLFGHLAERTGRRVQTMVVDVPPRQLGGVLLEGLALPPGRREVICFSDVPLRLEAVAAPGYEFAGWKGSGGGDPPVILETSGPRHVRPAFRFVVP